MTLSGTSSVSPSFGAGTQSGPVFSPAVLPGSSRSSAELTKTDLSSSATVDAASPSTKSVRAASTSAGITTSAATPKPIAVSAATASSEAARAAAVKTEQAATPAKSAVVGEEGQIRELRAQGQNLSQIAVDLNISVAAVNGDLQTDIPKFATPPPVAESSDHSTTISVFA